MTVIDLLFKPFAQVVINDIIILYLYSRLLNVFYNKKQIMIDKKWLCALIYAFTLVIFVAFNSLGIVYVNMIISPACYFILLFSCYKIENLRGIGYFTFFMIGCYLAEILHALIFGLFFEQGTEATTNYASLNFGNMAMLDLAEIGLAYLLCHYGNKERDRRYDKITILYMAVPIASVVVVCLETIRKSTTPAGLYNDTQFMVTMLILLFANIGFFLVLEKHTDMIKNEYALMKNEMKLKSDADIMEMAAEAMRERLESTEELVQQDRAMRHDRRHFEALLLSLIQEGKTDEVKRCLEERMAQEPHTVKRYCDNTTVNAAITHYISVAEKNDIKVEVSTNIPSELEVDDMQLAIAISNLLENAIHACEKLPIEDRYISLTAKYKNQLLLEVINSCDGMVTLDDEGYPVTSEDGHGTGTRSVLAFVSQTGSDIKYIAEDNRFKVRMIIN